MFYYLWLKGKGRVSSVLLCSCQIKQSMVTSLISSSSATYHQLFLKMCSSTNSHDTTLLIFLFHKELLLVSFTDSFFRCCSIWEFRFKPFLSLLSHFFICFHDFNNHLCSQLPNLYLQSYAYFWISDLYVQLPTWHLHLYIKQLS